MVKPLVLRKTCRALTSFPVDPMVIVWVKTELVVQAARVGAASAVRGF
jgi:hypothetical protein